MTEEPQNIVPTRLTREQSDAVRARQKSRARALGIILFAAAALFYAITIVKTGAS